MLSEFLNIIFKSLKLDGSLYNNKKNFTEASIYFALIIILLTSIVSLIPGSVFIQYMTNTYGLTGVKGPSFRSVLISSLIVWVIKTGYLYFVGVVLFPSNSTKCSFRKLLITVAYAYSPFIFYIFIIDIKLIYFTFIPYIWYCITLIIGLKHVLNYENFIKPSIISLAPQILLLAWILSQSLNLNSGTIS